MVKIETAHWRRISKAKARKLYISGKDIMIVPHKVNPENEWGVGSIVHQHPEIPEYERYWFWDRLIDQFVLYNCQYNELGKYPAFYERRDNNG